MSAEPLSTREPDARSEPDWPAVTAAIVAFDRREALRTTLRTTLEDLDYPREALDVVVVDNASTDGTAEMVTREFPTVRLLRLERNVGVPAWNRAFPVARGEWVLLLDDDCWISGDALKRAVSAAREEGADLVSFRVASSVDPTYFFDQDLRSGLLTFWGCSALISHRALDRLGGYDEAIFLWGNELELTVRLLGAGLRHLYLPDVVSVHMKGPPDQTDRVDLLRRYTINKTRSAYIAAKLLAPRDAGIVLGNLLTQLLFDVRAFDRQVARALPGVLAAFARGLRVRDPVPAAVSGLYRRDFFNFASPLRFLRGPAERLRARGSDQRAAADREARWERFYRERAALYPERRASLRV